MGSDIRSHHDLKVWQQGMDIAEHVYALTHEFPREELYGLTSQLRRAASSIPANVAEGNGRASIKDYLRFLSIAVGSLCEVETFLMLAVRLRYVSANSIEPLIGLLAEEGRMLRGLQKSLSEKIQPPQF
jgi:four helix bundle protein